METTINDYHGHGRPSSSYSSSSISKNNDTTDGKPEDWMQEYNKAMELGKMKHPSEYSFKDKPWITDECKKYLCIKLFYKKKVEKYKSDRYSQLLKIAKDKCKTILRSTKAAYEGNDKSLENSPPSKTLSDTTSRQKNKNEEEKSRNQPISTAAIINPKAPVPVSEEEEYPTWYDHKCKEMAVLKEYYQSILKMNRTDVEAMTNFKNAKKKLKHVEKDAYKKFKAKNSKYLPGNEKNMELKKPAVSSWRYMNEEIDDEENLEPDNSAMQKDPIQEEKGKWEPVPWKNSSEKEPSFLVKENTDVDFKDIEESPAEEIYKENNKRARYGQDEVESGEISSDDLKNSSWQVFSSKEMKKRKRKKMSDQKNGNDDDDSSMDVDRSADNRNLNPEMSKESGPARNSNIPGGPGFGPMMQTWAPNFQGPSGPERFNGPPGPNFNNGFQQPSGPGFFNQGPPGHGFNNQGPRFNNQGPPPMFNNQGPPMFNNQGPPRFNNHGPPQFNNQGPPRFNNQGPPGGFNNQGPPGGFNNQGPPGGFNNQGPGGFNNQGPPGGFNNQGPPGGFNNQGPGFNNQGPANFNQAAPGFNQGPSKDSNSGFAMHGPPRPPFNQNSNDIFQTPPGFNNMPSEGPISVNRSDVSGKEKSKYGSSSTKSHSRRNSSSDGGDSTRADVSKFSPFPPPPFSGQK